MKRPLLICFRGNAHQFSSIITVWEVIFFFLPVREGPLVILTTLWWRDHSDKRGFPCDRRSFPCFRRPGTYVFTQAQKVLTAPQVSRIGCRKCIQPLWCCLCAPEHEPSDMMGSVLGRTVFNTKVEVNQTLVC